MFDFQKLFYLSRLSRSSSRGQARLLCRARHSEQELILNLSLVKIMNKVERIIVVTSSDVRSHDCNTTQHNSIQHDTICVRTIAIPQ